MCLDLLISLLFYNRGKIYILFIDIKRRRKLYSNQFINIFMILNKKIARTRSRNRTLNYVLQLSKTSLMLR